MKCFITYIHEAAGLQETEPIRTQLQDALEKTEKLTNLSPKSIIDLDVPAHRASVNEISFAETFLDLERKEA